MARSLRSRVLLASVLWTGGLLSLMHLLSLTVIHALPGSQGGHAAIVGTSLGVILMLAGFVMARRSLTPLRGLEDKVVAVTTGHARRVDGAFPAEVQPVIDRLNVMLEDRERAITRAHAAAGDLAHALKTPLALLMREADVARAAGQTALADAITSQVRRMTAQIDRQLSRARVAASGPIGADRCVVAPCVDGLTRTMRRLHVDRSLDMVVDVPPDVEVLVRQEDLEEMLGNVLDNACKWATSKVALTVEQGVDTLAFVVDDDGAGLPTTSRDVVLQRGVRLDERSPGSGLGLAIVHDLVEHYRGTLTLESSPRGGLRVKVTLPVGPRA
ncbi:MAG: sensor histidine kinase [Acidobacteria bacterium]|nr:sensor histidine kinase [Acidobacteriota bacterium]